MARRKKEMSDKEALELLGNIFVVWPLKAIEYSAECLVKFGNWISRKAAQHDEKKKQKENKIVYNELEDWQKKKVDKGNYDETSFEEEELEDDDYYSEDDK